MLPFADPTSPRRVTLQLPVCVRVSGCTTWLAYLTVPVAREPEISCDFAALLDVADSAISYTLGHLRTNNMLTLHSLQATITRFRTRVARRVLAFSSRRAVKWRLSWLRRSKRVLRLLLRTFSCFALFNRNCDVSCLEDLQRALARC